MFGISLLILATFIWGLGFVGTRWTLVDYSPIWSNTLRFVIAGLISTPFLLKHKKLFVHKGAILCAILLGLGLQLQTIGIGLTSLAKAGFLTVLYALITPILIMVFYREKFRKTYWLLLLVAMFGIALLCDLKFENFNLGDLFILGAAFFFSLHILAIDKYCEGQNAVLFNLIQCFYIGVFSFAFGFLYEGLPSLKPLLDLSGFFKESSVLGFLILAVFSSLIAFSLQVYAQQKIRPHIVSLIFLTESIFAALFGFTFFDEILTPTAIVGCVLVLVSVAFIPLATQAEKTQ